MQTTSSVEVIDRFFIAISHLIKAGKIRGKATFARRYNINRRNLYQLEMDKSKDIFQVVWLSHLVVDYGVSPRWLLTGEGEVLT